METVASSEEIRTSVKPLRRKRSRGKKPRIRVYDATLREARQARGVNFGVEGMFTIAEALANFGVDYIEGGWPGASNVWERFFSEIRDGRSPRLGQAQLTAFGSTHRAKATAESDQLFQHLIDSPVSVVTVFGKSWIDHVTGALRTDGETNLRMVEASMAAIKKLNKQAIFDAEHFFQAVIECGYEYALAVLHAAVNGGADELVLCDTNGVAMGWDVERIVRRVVKEFPDVLISVHMHGDRGLATANTITAIVAGATGFQGTLNGYSERVQMASTIEVLANLHLLIAEGRLHAELSPNYKPELSVELSRLMDHISGVHPNPRLPFVGEAAATHKAGVHVSGVNRGGGYLYESHNLRTFGGERVFALSAMSGKANVLSATHAFWGVVLDESDPRISKILKEAERLEEEGLCLDTAGGSAAVLIARYLWPDLEGLEMPTEQPVTTSRGKDVLATLIFDGDKTSSAVGDGLVDAMVKAARDHYSRQHSCVADLRLFLFDSINITKPGLEEGSASLVRVEIEWHHGQFGKFSTQGVSTNLLEAAWEAIKDAFTYVLYKQHQAAKVA